VPRHDLATVIEDVRRDGRQRSTRCSAHDDQRASLSIGLGDGGQILVCCHVGCPTRAVIEAAGLTMADLASPDLSSTPSTAITTYAYRDERGELLYEVVRLPGKQFRQRRPDGQGGWVWKLGDVRRVLYRLPELEGHEAVVVCEGEKDADRLWSLKIPATSNSAGAGKWTADHAAQLQAAGVKRVIVIPDHDAPGAAHAETVARTCAAAGLEAKIARLPGLPEHGDASVFLASHTKADLVALLKAAPEWQPTTRPDTRTALTLTTVGDLLEEPEEQVNWLIEGLIPAAGVVVLAAKPKVGKSTAARCAALEVARGGSWLGRACERGTAWYVALEGRRRDIRAHFRQLGATRADPIHVFVGVAPADVKIRLRQLAEQERPALIVVDTLQRFLKAENTSDYAEMTTLFDDVIAIAQQSGATMLVLHHAGKADRANIDAILGSTAIAGSADSIILMGRTDRYRTISTVQRVGDDLPETVIRLHPDSGRVYLDGPRQDADRDAMARLMLEALQNADRPLTREDWLEAVEGRRQVKLSAFKALTTGNRNVAATGAGTRNDPRRFTFSVSDSGSQVPISTGEPENHLSDSTDFQRERSTDSGSRIPARGVSGSRTTEVDSDDSIVL